MNETDLLSTFSSGVETLLSILGREIEQASETDIEFSVKSYPPIERVELLTNNLMACSNIFDISLEYEIQNCKGSASLTAQGLISIEWVEDESLSPPEIEGRALNDYQILTNQLSQPGKKIEIKKVSQSLIQLKQAGALLELVLRVSLDKSKLINKLNSSKTSSLIIYIQSKKLLDLLHIENLVNISNLLIPNSENSIVLLLGDIMGTASGPNIKVLGRDHWNQADMAFATPPINTLGQDRIIASVNFLKEESSWENIPIGLTPYHFDISENKLTDIRILDNLSSFCDDLAILFLANRVTFLKNTLKCEFKGYKSVWLEFDAVNDKVGSVIYKLYSWIFENPSSDKIGIARQLITLQLSDEPSKNRTTLLERANDVLETSKSNFQVYLRRSVELYFDKRLKVGEFLQKFSEDVGGSVSTMTSDLLGNLYKTIGIILGDAIAIVLVPKYTFPIIFYTSLLYFAYIVFALIMQSTTYWKYVNKIKEYKHNVDYLSDVLTKGEITKLEGDSLSRSRTLFIAVFIAVNLIYALLAMVTFLILSNTRLLFDQSIG